ncbi:MAG: hypothetical protein CME43_01910 [Haliea sp.]|uniref:FAD-dependent thymidylate synthase n=1 Tax=Haliea sp. TaxID=1932666 RepID=UPI000C58043F|nr:FAD-dependent thymidylate synthase [Haliea sp.]MBM68174.1 hypothetical protein [Haliea sp.]MBM68217.1 hypothetical protein [Haliea sp.]|tara:strand:+ start:67460 stop:68371 length:912 start_codon:yes stop_codon:yes gene_type:complete
MSRPSAKVIAHSEAPNGEQLITLEIELHRFVLPENNTHRSFSRNYASSRACPVTSQLEQVANDPAMPVHWGKNQSGMVADKELSGMERKLAEMIILGMRDACLNGVKQLAELGLHKQVSNRYIEPWLWTKGVITTTKDEFDAFFRLRCHKDAQPEIKLLAERMRDAINSSVSVKLKVGDYHLPYIECYKPLGSGKQVFPVGNGTSEVYSLENAVKISTSCSAQVSYRRLDTSLEKALKIYDMLNLPSNGEFSDEPGHFSPTEHQAKVVDVTDGYMSSGNFHSKVFWQYRKALESGTENKFLTN